MFFLGQSCEGFLLAAEPCQLCRLPENFVWFNFAEKLFAFLTLLTYRIGEVFIHLSSEETQEYLESAKSKLQEEVKLLESQSGEVKALLGDLKVKLYAKFGNNINLEAEEEWKKSNIVASRLVAVLLNMYSVYLIKELGLLNFSVIL